MSFENILVVLRSFPTLTPISAVEDAVELAVALRARISAIACAIAPRAPRSPLGNALLDLSGLVADQHRQIVAAAQEILTIFKEMATKHGVLGDHVLRKCEPSEVPRLLAEYTRVHDLTIMPMPEGGYLSQLDSHWYAETVIFESGHPAIILPHERKGARPIAFNTVAVAWDGSRAAARAIKDALPILQKARITRVVTVTNEKPLTTVLPSARITQYLASHGVSAIHELVDAAVRTIGQVFRDYALTQGVDLIVMGAYGHSRFREFVLGGATKSMLTHPPAPIFLSH